jgi:hypothetical protein
MNGLTISFRGLDADAGHVEAFSGIESAAGIARALTLIGHYAATGVVRHRYPSMKQYVSISKGRRMVASIGNLPSPLPDHWHWDLQPTGYTTLQN